MNFNKIKNILNGGPEEVIRKSLTRSTMLELSEDGSKVKRKDDVPMKTQEEIDDLTIYVEQIPLNSTHESISSVFSTFGKVNYVSLPRYKKTRQIKQFGFVEFESEESITKAINCFKKVDGVLLYSSLKAETLLSIATHEKEETESSEKPEENESDEPPTKKVRLETTDEHEFAAPKVESLIEEVGVKEKQQEKSETTDGDEKVAEDSTGVEQKEGEVVKKKKKNRPHKKKPARKAFFDERIMAMKIMRKKEWKKMRNAYLNLERQKAKEIKKFLRNKRNNKAQEYQKFSPAVNFYGSPSNDRDEAVEPITIEQDTNLSSGLSTIPSGVIVNIKFREPCLDQKELKKEFKQYSFINYVDILEGGAQCYIRVDASNSAQELVSQYSSCEYETEILKDEAEKEYWKKIFEKRDSKKNKEASKIEQKPVKRRRGREKLLDKINKAAQHIRFDDEDVVE